MKTVTVNSKLYTIHFRYLSRYGKRPHFWRHAPFQAITICTILADEGKFIAQDVAVCSLTVAPKPTPAMQRVLSVLKEVRAVPSPWQEDREIACYHADAEQKPDQYSRREGRRISLLKTLERCGALRKIKDEFLDEYEKLDPAPLVPLRKKISDSRKEELMAQGQEGKEERRLLRKKNKALRKGV
jgi:hypothetical protein